MSQRVKVTIDLGAGAPIEMIRQVIDDLDTVCQFGGELTYQASVARAELEVLSRLEALGRKAAYTVDTGLAVPVDWYRQPIPDAIIDQEVASFLASNPPTEETVTTVESIRYSNPIEIVLVGCYLTIKALELIRDWPSRRRINDAVAKDAENTVAARKEIRDEIVRRIVEDREPIAVKQIDELVTLDVAQSMQNLGRVQLNLRELTSADGSGD